jgi:hypothetical protein
LFLLDAVRLCVQRVDVLYPDPICQGQLISFIIPRLFVFELHSYSSLPLKIIFNVFIGSSHALLVLIFVYPSSKVNFYFRSTVEIYFLRVVRNFNNTSDFFTLSLFHFPIFVFLKCSLIYPFHL